MIHTANPVEHANNAMVQPNFINPVHHASVDLSGHNLVNAHQASGTATRESDMFFSPFCPLHHTNQTVSTFLPGCLKHNRKTTTEAYLSCIIITSKVKYQQLIMLTDTQTKNKFNLQLQQSTNMFKLMPHIIIKPVICLIVVAVEKIFGPWYGRHC